MLTSVKKELTTVIPMENALTKMEILPANAIEGTMVMELLPVSVSNKFNNVYINELILDNFN